MTVWGALAGGFAGTVVLTTGLQAASHAGLSRMDIPFLLGTAFTTDRARARALGHLLHFVAGQAFALAYFALFGVLGRSGFALGALFGLVHGLFAGTVLVNVLLPAAHPYMGTPASAADSRPLLEQPGFLMLNYGVGAPLASIAGHLVYGAVVGGFVALSG